MQKLGAPVTTHSEPQSAVVWPPVGEHVVDNASTSIVAKLHTKPGVSLATLVMSVDVTVTSGVAERTSAGAVPVLRNTQSVRLTESTPRMLTPTLTSLFSTKTLSTLTLSARNTYSALDGSRARLSLTTTDVALNARTAASPALLSLKLQPSIHSELLSTVTHDIVGLALSYVVCGVR